MVKRIGRQDWINNGDGTAQRREQWFETTEVEPAEGQVVKAMDSGGHVQPLKRVGSLWFVPDGSMYVYFTPQRWAPADASQEG